MDKVFHLHVENREFSPLIVRRSFKNYINQFDPKRLYLLSSEVEPFLNFSDGKVQQIIVDYQHESFFEYFHLNRQIQDAILRHQKLRKKQIEKILLQENLDFNEIPLKENYGFASSLAHLKRRIRNSLIRDLKKVIQKRKIKHVKRELLEKILTFYDKKYALLEEPYLSYSEKEHQLSLHILKALVRSLDAHSGYYSPKEAYEIRTNLKKEFSGIGVVVKEEFDGIFIEDVIFGSPADRSHKITKGDHIVSIDQKTLTGKNFVEVLDLMKGEVKSKITLQLVKEKDKDQIVTVELIREKIVINEERLSFKEEPFGNGIIGKIRLSNFYDNGGKISSEMDLREALRTLRNKENLRGLILDFRDNSGGFLSQAIKVAAMFIDGGIIVVSKYAEGEVSYVRDVDGRFYYEGPLIILVSKASASAAEIVAGALQDHGVALIVGDKRTYGKGSMQYQNLTDETATKFFKVTVGRYYTASGRSPQIEGVESDIFVPTIFHPYNIGERYLEHSLKSEHLSFDLFDSLTRLKKDPAPHAVSLSIPYLIPRESMWRKMLFQLIQNSQKRLLLDPNFQFFLKIIYQKEKTSQEILSLFKSKRQNFGKEDLQLKEAVEIIKDMVLMNQKFSSNR